MKAKKSILWITRTAIFTALLIVLQMATSPLGNQFVTGAAVNLILIMSVMTCGLSSGVTVALISPIFAKLLGIGPVFWELIPFMALGNLVLVIVWYSVGNRKIGKSPFVPYTIALVSGAALKFATLYLGIAKLAVPYILKLAEPKASMISTMFSLPQLVTALIGGALAIIVLPLIKKSLSKS